MNNEKLLTQIVQDFKQIEEVKAIALGGSTSAQMSDELSDFDIYIYSNKEIDVEKRRAIALKYSDRYEIDNRFFETGDELTLRETGKGIDIMYRRLSDIEGNVKWVWEGHNASVGYTTCFVDNLYHSQILYDSDGRFTELQNRVKTPYPEELAKNIIAKNLPLVMEKPAASFYEQLEYAVKRNDMVSVCHRSAAFLASYFDVLFAKNKVLHPGEKRLVQFTLKYCKLIPKSFEQEINEFSVCPVHKKLELAQKLYNNLKKIL